MAMAASVIQSSPLSFNCCNNEKPRIKHIIRVHSSGIKTKNKVSPLSAVGLRSGLGNRRQSLLICHSAINAKCSEGQTQTVTRESPTITQAPVHSKEKSPSLDDGGDGFPPRDDGDGGGGGGGGGNWSGGFFFFGFLAFLGLLKDKEGEEDYRGSRRR
ncbi:PREDICTED: uncharacterized protein LOC104778502 [Camelina sativa]|uniref:Uncharacterized protein LOC104778502 n=1 Tax=Camelina sativa TaxID=90675 RepID=A0ABM0YI93_CAMSA|nr:PREDICTED: uncharacterized protein LOC104778502 [Camelina sativa]